MYEIPKLKKMNTKFNMSSMTVKNHSNNIEAQIFTKFKANKNILPKMNKKTSVVNIKSLDKDLFKKLNMNTFGSAQKRMNVQQKFSLLGDKDKDGVPNIYDCNPFNKRKQGGDIDTVTRPENDEDKIDVKQLEKYGEEQTLADQTLAEQAVQVLKKKDETEIAEEKQPKYKVEYSEQFVPHGITNKLEYARQHPQAALRNVAVSTVEGTEAALQYGKKVLQFTGGAAKEAGSAVRPVAEDLLGLPTQKEVEAKKLTEQQRKLDAVLNYQTKKALLEKVNSLPAKDLQKLYSEQQNKLRKGGMSLGGLEPKRQSALDKISPKTEKIHQGFSMGSGGSPYSLEGAARLPQRQPYGSVVQQSLTSGVQRVTPTLMSQRPTLVSGMEIPRQSTLIPQRSPDDIALQQLKQQPVQQNQPVVIQQQGVVEDNGPPPGKPEMLPDGRIWSPNSKKYVRYIRPKYVKHKPRVIVQQVQAQ